MNGPRFTLSGGFKALPIYRDILLKTLTTPCLPTLSRLSLVSIICLYLAPALAFAKDDYTIEQEDGLFTVSAHEASLASVIDKLSEMTEIPMNIAEGQDTQVTLSFSEYTLESLIAELTSSSMIVRKNIDGDDVISEVVFMLGSEGNDTAAAALPSGEPNEGIIAGSEEEAQATDAAAPTENPQTEIQTPEVADPQTGQPAQPAQPSE